MDRKGTIWTVVGTAIALVFLDVIILSIFCPGKCLAPLLAAGSEGIADLQLGSIRKEKFEKTTINFDPQVEAAFNNIISALRSDGTGPCIMQHIAFPNDFKDNKIALARTSDGILAQLINKAGQMETKTVIGKAPCVVGEGVAENFYNNFLDGSLCKTNCPSNSIESNIVITKNNEIYINGEKRDLKDNNLLFKAVDGNVCFFPTESDSTWSANFKCEKKKKGIDDDCFDEEIQENVISCDQMSIPFAQELIDKGYSKEFRDIAINFSNAIKQAVNSEEDVCRVEFSNYPDFGDDQKIAMFNINGNLQVDAQGKNKDSVVLQTETSFVPCIVHGQNFWKWLIEDDNSARDNQHIDKSWVTLLKGDDVKFLPKDSDNKDKRDLYKERPLIYKAGKGHICIMHKFVDNGRDCGSEKKENAKRNAVDDDCIQIWSGNNNDWFETILEGNTYTAHDRTPIC